MLKFHEHLPLPRSEAGHAWLGSPSPRTFKRPIIRSEQLLRSTHHRVLPRRQNIGYIWRASSLVQNHSRACFRRAKNTHIWSVAGQYRYSIDLLSIYFSLLFNRTAMMRDKQKCSILWMRDEQWGDYVGNNFRFMKQLSWTNVNFRFQIILWNYWWSQNFRFFWIYSLWNIM